MPDADDPAALPPKVYQSVVKFIDKNIRFNYKAVPGCEPSQIATATTEDALAACGDAEGRSGEAVVNLPFASAASARTSRPSSPRSIAPTRTGSSCIRGSLPWRRRPC